MSKIKLFYKFIDIYIINMKEKIKKISILAAIIIIPGGELLALLYYGFKKTQKNNQIQKDEEVKKAA